jgi:hypothetical protein
VEKTVRRVGGKTCALRVINGEQMSSGRIAQGRAWHKRELVVKAHGRASCKEHAGLRGRLQEAGNLCMFDEVGNPSESRLGNAERQ